ncbi:hypothetical protein HJC23_009455 [Cyclotella cryptica]|uniref:Uncharacterized protein n=1 Tax=Cyclotella cryptica TaxID=29204 RepID=A0ABD3Q1Y9_9STRA
MTSPALTLGSALLAFSPSLSLLLLFVSPKPQLLILAICSAFAYLISALLSSALWWLFSLIPGSDDGWGALLTLVLPSVLCQCIVRCGFVKMYFRVEDVIRRSVAKHEAETAAESHDHRGDHAETNALQLQLNDLACALASGAGYAFLHSLFLYGTLLASESGEQYTSGGGTAREGTLYQASCTALPSLINGALISGMFSILDVIWMCSVFYGMRRRSIYSTQHNGTMSKSIIEGMMFWNGLPDSSKGGNAALGLVVVSHLAASLALAPNATAEGCRISLPLLGAIVILVGVLFVRGVGGHYLPQDQRRRIGGMRGDDGGGGRIEHHVD